MPNTTSAKKRLRQNKVRRDRNRSLRTTVRNRCKKLVKSVGTGNVQESEVLFVDAVQVLDKMGAKGIIHKNAASRKKARLSALLKKLKVQNAAS